MDSTLAIGVNTVPEFIQVVAKNSPYCLENSVERELRSPAFVGWFDSSQIGFKPNAKVARTIVARKFKDRDNRWSSIALQFLSRRIPL